MSLQTFGKGVVRVAKNYTKGYSDVQAKVRDATSNDPWGPSGTQMNEIAQLTFNQNDFVEIMEMLDKRLNDKGKNWRHVFKALTLLDYLIHAGSENVVIYFKDNLYVIKTLKEFQFIDEYSKDQGANVRQKAKDITNLLTDDSRLRQERRTRRDMRDRLVGERDTGDSFPDDENTRRRSRSQPPASREPAHPRRRGTGEDDELRKAMEESRRSAMADEERRKRNNNEQTDLEKALELSRAEAERQQRNAQDSNGLFNDAAQRPHAQQNDSLIDMSLAPQPTLQPQFTAFNPNPYYAQLQAEQEAQQQAYLQQQAAAQQQAQQEQWMQEQFLLQQQAAQQAAQQQEWERMQFMLQQQQQQQLQQQMPTGFPSLAPQPTGFGSNNPFAPFAPATSPPPMPSSFSQSNIYTQSSFQSPQPQFAGQGQDGLGPERAQSAPIRVKTNDQNAHLANLFANRDDGVDSFGNTGQLRYGQYAGRLQGQATGAPQQQQGSHNPFGQFGVQPQQQQGSSDQPFFTI